MNVRGFADVFIYHQKHKNALVIGFCDSRCKNFGRHYIQSEPLKEARGQRIISLYLDLVALRSYDLLVVTDYDISQASFYIGIKVS